MGNTGNRDVYMQRKAQQLIQWENVIDKLKTREARAKDKGKTDLQHHLLKIQVVKTRTEVILRRLQRAANGDWETIRTEMEESWRLLRRAFAKASMRPKLKNR